MSKMKDYLFDQVSELGPETQDTLLGGAPMYHGSMHSFKKGDILTGEDSNVFKTYNYADSDTHDRVFATTNLQFAQFFAEGSRANSPFPGMGDDQVRVYQVEPHSDKPMGIDMNLPDSPESFTSDKFRVTDVVMDKSHEDWPDVVEGPAGMRSDQF